MLMEMLPFFLFDPIENKTTIKVEALTPREATSIRQLLLEGDSHNILSKLGVEVLNGYLTLSLP